MKSFENETYFSNFPPLCIEIRKSHRIFSLRKAPQGDQDDSFIKLSKKVCQQKQQLLLLPPPHTISSPPQASFCSLGGKNFDYTDVRCLEKKQENAISMPNDKSRFLTMSTFLVLMDSFWCNMKNFVGCSSVSKSLQMCKDRPYNTVLQCQAAVCKQKM